eukprot:7618165-Alexandrium_andersonii.AAC.1
MAASSAIRLTVSVGYRPLPASGTVCSMRRPIWLWLGPTGRACSPTYNSNMLREEACHTHLLA